MSGITLEQAQANLDALVGAQLTGTLAFSVGGRSYSFRSMADLMAGIKFWQGMVRQLSNPQNKSRINPALVDLSTCR